MSGFMGRSRRRVDTYFRFYAAGFFDVGVFVIILYSAYTVRRCSGYGIGDKNWDRELELGVGRSVEVVLESRRFGEGLMGESFVVAGVFSRSVVG